MVVSKDRSDGRVMVLASYLEVPMIRVDGSWSVGTFSAYDLKDNFERVSGKFANALLNEAKTAFSSNIGKTKIITKFRHISPDCSGA